MDIAGHKLFVNLLFSVDLTRFSPLLGFLINGTRTGYRLFAKQKTTGQHLVYLVYLVWTMLNGHGTVLQLITLW